MKPAVVFCFVLTATFCKAEDDGQYHPERYGGDDGKYHPKRQYRYYPTVPYVRNVYGGINPIFPTYQPVQFKQYSPYPGLLAPIVSYGSPSSVDNIPFASSVDTVTVRPISIPVSTISPIVYSATPKPLVQIIPNTKVLARLGDKSSNILRQDNDISNGAYHYAYQTDNGIAAEESGAVDAALGGTRTGGFYEYIGDDGRKYRVDYTADENGFRPTGAHLP